MKRFAIPLAVVTAILLAAPPPAHAGLLQGLVEIVAGVLEVPRAALVGTFTGPPVVGTVGGVLVGAVRGVGLLAGGAFHVVTGVVPLALKAAPFIPIFL